MIKILLETDVRLKCILSVWEEISIEKKEFLIESYWNVALNERDILKDIDGSWSSKGIFYRRPDLNSHLDYLYYNSFLAFNLYLRYKGEWNTLREDMQEISLLLWKFSKGPYAYSLFKNIGRNSRERKILLKGFHNSKLNMKECTVCKKMVNASNYRQHYKKCYKDYAKKGNRLKNI